MHTHKTTRKRLFVVNSTLCSHEALTFKSVPLTCVALFPAPTRRARANVWLHAFSSIHAHGITDTFRKKDETALK